MTICVLQRCRLHFVFCGYGRPTCRKNSETMFDVCVLVDRLLLKCDGTRVETRLSLSTKRMSPFKSAGASVQSTTGSRSVRISDSNAGYTMIRGSVKGTGYPLHSPVPSSLPLPYITVCHHISTGLYNNSLLPTVFEKLGILFAKLQVCL